jgi:hypothetical protein
MGIKQEGGTKEGGGLERCFFGFDVRFYCSI